MRVGDHRNLMIVVLEEGSLEAAQASGLYGYPHEVEDRSRFPCLPRVLAPLQRLLLMADVLPLNQSLIVLGTRKKKDEDLRRIKAPAAFFLFPTLEGGKEEEEATNTLDLCSPCLRLNQEEEEGSPRLEEEGFHLSRAPALAPFLKPSRAPTI